MPIHHESIRYAQTKTVLDGISGERDRQVARGYTPEHDDAHSDAEFAALVIERLGSALSFFPPVQGPVDYDSPATGRVYLEQTAALIVAWIEAIDRRPD